MAKVRAHVVIEGRVQGVWFRGSTQDEALGLALTGWVKNRRDGKVEALFEGEASAVERMIEWCRLGPPAARVENVQVSRESPTGEFSGFDITW